MSSSQVSLIYSTKTSVPYILKKSAPCIFNKKSAPYIFNRKKSILRLNFIFLHQKLYEKVTKVWWVERIFFCHLCRMPKKACKKTHGELLLHRVPNKSTRRSLTTITVIFLRITQYIRDTHNARTLISMNTRTQTLPLRASSKIVSANPQD
jgi:hypothetical protein